VKKYIFMVSALLTISCYPMKRFRDISDDQKLNFLAQKYKEHKELARIAQAHKVQEFFFPDYAIAGDEISKALQHADEVVAILNATYATNLKCSSLPDVMRKLSGVEGERLTRFVQHVMQESYPRKDNSISKVLTAIENDLQQKYYILTGVSGRVKRNVTGFWRDDMQNVFNAAQECQIQLHADGMRLMGPS
jgi:hypothetical protein